MAVALVGAAATTVDAQEREIELARRVSGPYQITLFAQPPEPVAGLGTRLTVHLLAAADGRPVPDATVQLTMTKPDGELLGPVEFLRQPTSQGFYGVLISMDDSGRWGFTVTATGALGAGSGDGAIVARTPDRAGWTGTVTWLVAVGVVAGIALLAWATMRRRSAIRSGGPRP